MLIGLGWWQHRQLVLALGLVWLAHIGLDRLQSYGLKYGNSFQHTHLGILGRRKEASCPAFDYVTDILLIAVSRASGARSHADPALPVPPARPGGRGGRRLSIHPCENAAWTDSRAHAASETTMRRAAGDSTQARRRRPLSR